MIAGGQKVAPVRVVVDDLLEHHGSTLFPALLKHAAGASDVLIPLERVEAALKGNTLLSQDSDIPSAADVCIGVDILAYSDTTKLPSGVSSFLLVRR